MIYEKTERGFALYKFIDTYSVECSLQKSSLATDDCVWLGCDTISLKRMVPGRGWVDVELDAEFEWLANTRMHLNRETAQQLIEKLQHFVDTGELPTPEQSPCYDNTMECETEDGKIIRRRMIRQEEPSFSRRGRGDRDFPRWVPETYEGEQVLEVVGSLRPVITKVPK